MHVGPFQRSRRRVGVPEASGLKQGGRDRSALEQEIFQSRPDRAVQLRIAVVGKVALALRNRIEVEVVLKILPDARQIVDRRDADRLQMIGRTDA